MRVTTLVRKLLAQLPLESTAEAILLHGLRMQLRCSLLKVRYTAQRGISPDTACASHQPAAFCMLQSRVLVLIIAFLLIFDLPWQIFVMQILCFIITGIKKKSIAKWPDGWPKRLQDIHQFRIGINRDIDDGLIFSNVFHEMRDTGIPAERVAFFDDE